MSDETPTNEEVVLRRHLLRLGAAMEAAPSDGRRTVIALDDGGRRRKRPTRLIGVGAGVAAAAALLVGLLVVRSADHRPAGTTRTSDVMTTPTATTAPSTPHTVSMADLLGYLMPATSADYNSGADMALGNFLMKAGAHEDAACLRSKGWSDSVADYFAHRSDRSRVPVPMNNSQFPDIAGSRPARSRPTAGPPLGRVRWTPRSPRIGRRRPSPTCAACENRRAARPDLIDAVFDQLTGVVDSEQHPYGLTQA